MKKYFMLFSVVCGLALTGCCTTHHAGRWEYQTLVIAGGLVPLGPGHAGEPPGNTWKADDATLNSMLKEGWKVASFSVDNGNQYFLLKRHKLRE